ncbi:mycothiol transferase [Pseudarthrobacter raffinosi]|uniref:mycothiol transferase n=1 Tax=Pseudarthrobacter raffinosi TaxID=2953651 RepID=UPI0027E39FCA|nr:MULTISPECIES: DUF664 domain-containing protein [unclassified Pseudarthrobacter]
MSGRRRAFPSERRIARDPCLQYFGDVCSFSRVRRERHPPARARPTPDESFILTDQDTIASVRRAHREACEASREATSLLELDDVLRGNRRGPLPLHWVYLHVLREFAQHCGHADILREQILNG